MTALCLLYLANFFADPFSLNSTKFAKEISLPVFSDLTNILESPLENVYQLGIAEV